jgi:hypothetical protein
MNHDQERSLAVPDQPAPGMLAVEEHGRAVTSNIEAAAHYRRAQRAADSLEAVTALRLSVNADPAFELAIADLGAITETHPIPIRGRTMNWERHHIEVVRIAASGDFSRASALLREHLAGIGCDPLAFRIVVDLGRRMESMDGLEDLTRRLPNCHPTCPWT